jgi:positive regulator of sigma E activity
MNRDPFFSAFGSAVLVLVIFLISIAIGQLVSKRLAGGKTVAALVSIIVFLLTFFTARFLTH